MSRPVGPKRNERLRPPCLILSAVRVSVYSTGRRSALPLSQIVSTLSCTCPTQHSVSMTSWSVTAAESRGRLHEWNPPDDHVFVHSASR